MPHRTALYDYAFNDIRYVGQTDDRLFEFFKHYRAGCARGFRDPESQVAGWPPHRNSQVPAPGCAAILHKPLDQLDPEMAGRFKPKSRHWKRKPKIVVDAFWYKDDPNRSAGLVLDGDGATRHVVAADRDQRFDLQLFERGNRIE